MADARNSTEVLLFSKALTAPRSLDVPGLKDSCTCSQGGFEASSMDVGSTRKAMASFAPQEITSISEFMQLRDSLIEGTEAVAA